MITNPAYYDVANYLMANSFSNVYSGGWGRGQDEQTLVLNGVGVPSDMKELYEHAGVQILVRGKDGTADFIVYQEAKRISDFLLGLPERVEMGGVCYSGFEEESSITNLGKDEKQRFIYSMNFSTYRNRF